MLGLFRHLIVIVPLCVRRLCGRSSMSAAYRITPTSTLLRIELVGALEDADVAELARDLQRMFKVLAPGGFNVLINCLALSRYSSSARDALIDVQSTIAQFARRTAYLADRPVIRGMALWIAHLSGDQNAKVVVTHAQAEQWWNQSDGRISAARKGMR